MASKESSGGSGVFTKLSNKMKGLFSSSSSSEPKMVISKPTGEFYFYAFLYCIYLSIHFNFNFQLLFSKSSFSSFGAGTYLHTGFRHLNHVKADDRSSTGFTVFIYLSICLHE